MAYIFDDFILCHSIHEVANETDIVCLDKTTNFTNRALFKNIMSTDTSKMYFVLIEIIVNGYVFFTKSPPEPYENVIALEDFIKKCILLEHKHRFKLFNFDFKPKKIVFYYNDMTQAWYDFNNS